MELFTRFRAATLAGAVALAVSSFAAHAGTILETATPTGDDLGDYPVTSVNSRVFGATFSVSGPAHITSVGFGSGRFGSGTVFAAIVPVDPVTGLPLANYNALAATALGSTLIDVPATNGDATGLLSLDLDAGEYAVVFGTDQFGASGVGPFTYSNTIVGNPQMFDSFFGSDWETFTDSVRMFVNGDVAAGTVPEPATLALFAAGLIGLGGLAQRRKANAGF